NWEYAAEYNRSKVPDVKYHQSLIFRNSIIKELGQINGDLDKITSSLNYYRISIRNHLLNEGYISVSATTSGGWHLSKKGELMKELGGHKKYQEYRQNELNIIRNQGKINNWLIAATLSAGLVPALLFAVDKIWFREKHQSKFSVQIHADSS